MKPEVSGALFAFGILLLVGWPLNAALGACAAGLGLMGLLRTLIT